MIYNISHDTFGHVRMGDLVAICNIVEYLRLSDAGVKFHMRPDSIDQATHCKLFYSYLLLNTDYFSEHESQYEFPWKKVNVWDFRAISGDLIRLKNTAVTKKKIVIFPLFDATYNIYRNWPETYFIDNVQYTEHTYVDYERVICISNKDLLPKYDYSKFTISTDFLDNINHIMSAEIFMGGDTGTTHFAFALDRGPTELLYCTSGRGLLHTTPFHLLNGKGKLKHYWLNFENTQWGNN